MIFKLLKTKTLKKRSKKIKKILTLKISRLKKDDFKKKETKEKIQERSADSGDKKTKRSKTKHYQNSQASLLLEAFAIGFDFQKMTEKSKKKKIARSFLETKTQKKVNYKSRY